MLRDDGGLTFTTYHVLDHPGKDKYNSLAHKLVASRLIIKIILSTRYTWYIS